MTRRPPNPLPLAGRYPNWPPRGICLLLTLVATLALCLQAAIGMMVDPWRQAGTRQLTIEITTNGTEAAETIQTRIQATLSALRAMPAIETANLMDEKEMQELLAPWLPSQAVPEGLPLPILIDVSLRKGERPTTADILSRMPEAGSGLTIDTHTAMIGDLAALAGLVRISCWAVALLTVAALLLAVVAMSRIQLDALKPTIDLLTTLGGTQLQIADLFATFLRQLYLPASFAGFALGLAGATVIFLSAMWFGLHQLGGFGISRQIVVQSILSLALVPITMLMAGPLAARYTVLQHLKQNA